MQGPEGTSGESKSGAATLACHGMLRLVCSPVCNKRFNRPSSLNTHMAVHTGAKRELKAFLTLRARADLSWAAYQCSRPECGRRFSVSSNLRRHEKVSSEQR